MRKSIGLFQNSICSQAGYIRFLQAQAGAFFAFEAAVESIKPRHLLPDWDRRRRSHLLAADLAELAVRIETPSAVPLLRGPSEVLGTVYVLEGSRLGGKLLARSVPNDLPRSFLEAGNPELWQSLIKTLNDKLTMDQERRSAASAAQRAFTAFHRSACRQLEAAGSNIRSASKTVLREFD